MCSPLWPIVLATSCPSSFFGPFQITQHVGTVAYRLQLLPSASIHDVFHVSLLKASKGNQQVSPSLPSDLMEF